MARRYLALTVLLAGLATGCAEEPRSGGEHLWQEREEWVRMDDGWARAVRLDGAVTLRASRPGEVFSALALPAPPGGAAEAAEGDGSVVFTQGGETQTLAVNAPLPLQLPLDPGSPANLEAHGVALVAPRRGRPGRAGRTLLLVVADTLRADHVTAELTPEILDAFAGGTRFARAYGPASWTLPSLAATFTGRPPVELRTPDGTLISIAEDEVTLAEALRERGFRGVAATANYTVNHENGFSAGFDLFFAPPVLEHGTAPDADWVVERALRARQWLAEEDVFLYVHLMEPHEPYRNHETGTVESAIPRDTDVTEEQLERLRAAYRSEVRHLSRGLAPLFAGLGDVELAVFTADHGEELWDHGGVGHGPTLYPEVVHVPLLVRGTRVEDRVLDAPATLLNLRGLFTGEDRRLFEPGQRVVMDTFAHGPPRFARVDASGQTIAFARQLADPEPDRSPRGLPPLSDDPIERWLDEHHPPLLFLPRDGGADEGLPPGASTELLSSLVEHFTGFRAGTWVLVRGVDGVQLEVRGAAAADSWMWGRPAELVVLRPVEADLRLDLRMDPGQPWTLLFFPPSSSASVGVEVMGDTPWTSLEGASTGGWLEAGVTIWTDEGRPQTRLRGLEETLDRLETLGYIDR